jgi:LacI family transcriptional regulator
MGLVGYSHNAVASSLRTKRSYIVMLMIPNIDNPFWPGVARALQLALAEVGYAVVYANTDWNAQQERALLEMARRNRFDAIVLNPVAVTTAELAALDVPTVVLGLRRDYVDVDIVGSDSYQGTRDALNYLYGLGHRRIGFILADRAAGRARARAYADFLTEQNLPSDAQLVAGASYTAEGGRQAARQLAHLADPPTAIYASNDVMALAALQELTALGLRVPADISVMGMDDIEFSSISTPPLTTMAKDKAQLGLQAAGLILSRLDGGTTSPARRIVVPCTLIERQSVAAPRTTKLEVPA